MSLASKLAEERRARLAAERLLELKQAELFAANRKLGRHAKALHGEVVEKRAEVANVLNENKRVKAELGVANHKVEVAERRLWHSIQTISDGFAYFNVDNELIAANNAYLEVFDGLEMIKPGVSYVTILQLLTEEGIVNTEALSPTDWRQMMLDRWMHPLPEPITVRLWNDMYVRMIDRRGEGGDIVSLNLNITETVEYEKQLKGAREAAESANRAKSAFLANMSHEIRTPMNGVVGMAELLADSGLSEEQELYVETIRNSGEALLVIINDVLDYSKIEADKLELHPEPFDLERSIHEVIMLLQPGATEKGLSLLLDFDLFLPTKYIGDPGRIRQVLTNLAGNAIKFTQTGHVLVRVTGVPDDEGKPCRVNISIEDTGIGIPEDKLKHIFGEFNQVENERNRQFDGTGLGLAISQRLVGMMGGEIWVTSEEGVGSCFGFSVNLDVVSGEESAQPIIPSGLSRVMVVDDLEVNRDILAQRLIQLGLDVVSCGSGEEALMRIEEAIDLILVAHSMPRMDGLELASELRSRSCSTPILLLSQNPGFAANDPARKHVEAVLQTPVSRRDLFRRLEEIGARVSEAGVPEKDQSTEAAPGEDVSAEEMPVPEPELSAPELNAETGDASAKPDASLNPEDEPPVAEDELHNAAAELEEEPAEFPASVDVSESEPEDAAEPMPVFNRHRSRLSEPDVATTSPEVPAGPETDQQSDDAPLTDQEAIEPTEPEVEPTEPEVAPVEPEVVAESAAPSAPDEAVPPVEELPPGATPDTFVFNGDAPSIENTASLTSASEDATTAEEVLPTDAAEPENSAEPSVTNQPEAQQDAEISAQTSIAEPEAIMPDPVPDLEPPAIDPIMAPTPEAPVLASPEPDPVPPAAIDAPAEQVPRKLRILAAEDNKTNQLVFRKMVKDLDIDLTFAANGEEAVKFYQTIAPDIVFMDISMPIMDGRTATVEIRKIENASQRHVPIVAMTAHALNGDEQGILAAGIDHYMTKPLRKPLIIEKILQLSPEGVLPPLPEEEQELAS